MINEEIILAKEFVENTGRNIFLTGNAGTGKTTFLHTIKSESFKRSIIVAPTGVAAINAKGVTIHSFFQLPFGPFLPENLTNDVISHKFSKTKINIIKTLDLLIIDEISMVRADLLDAIDYTLCKYKDRNKVFGGVQVLMIGDLQQLAPIVRQDEWNLLKQKYETPFFFSSKAYKQAETVNIELKHIYRQQNPEFITILNQVRNNSIDDKTLEILNSRYIPDFDSENEQGYITLTTHNNKADNINQNKLNKLRTEEKTFKAKITGDFPEYMYPTHQKLVLKKDAQVMFIKNDSSPLKEYYNGKIGKIVDFEDDEIIVSDNEGNLISVGYEKWDNVKYTIDDETKAIKEDVKGSFLQIPLRLAWAITIHKSQGLTFDKVVIDVNDAFAHGQTYVALSRCRTLNGIVLKSKVERKSIIHNNQVVSFTNYIEQNKPDKRVLQFSKKDYQLNIISEMFDYTKFEYQIKKIFNLYYKNTNILRGNIKDIFQEIYDNAILEFVKIAQNFEKQLRELSKNIEEPQNDNFIKERISKAVKYFKEKNNELIINKIKDVSFNTDNKSLKTDIEKTINEISETASIKQYILDKLSETEFSTAFYLKTKAQALLQKETKKLTKIKIDYSAKSSHPELFELLRQLRSVLAQQEDIHVYQVFTQESLFEMCEILPASINQLKKINGIGKTRIKKYGEEILEVINNYCKQNGIEQKEDIIPEKSKKIDSKSISLKLFKEGKNIAEIAENRGLVKSTIESHLSHFVKIGEIKAEELINTERLNELRKLVKENQGKTSTEIREISNNKFSYFEIRVVLLESKN